MSKSEIQIWLFVFFQTYGFLLWDSDGYIYLRGNMRRIIFWRFISGMTTVKCKCTRRRIDFQNYFIKNQIWCFTIVEVTKNSEILSPILYGFAVNHADTMKIELDWREILFTFSDLGHMACNTITITWYRNVTIWRLCCSFKTIISRKETFCEIDFSFMFFFIQSEASVSSWALWLVENTEERNNSWNGPFAIAVHFYIQSFKRATVRRIYHKKSSLLVSS